MSRKIVPPSNKDINGAYLPPVPPPVVSGETPSFKDPDVDLQGLLYGQLLALARTTKIYVERSLLSMTKDDVAALATLIKVTMELRAQEKELFDKLTEEELANVANST